MFSIGFAVGALLVAVVLAGALLQAVIAGVEQFANNTWSADGMAPRYYHPGTALGAVVVRIRAEQWRRRERLRRSQRPTLVGSVPQPVSIPARPHQAAQQPPPIRE